MGRKHYFDEYTCIGDSMTLERDGIIFTVSLEYDDVRRPTDYECYSEDDVKAWRKDEWSFCGIVFRAEKNGVDLGIVDSLWRIEIGDYFKDYHVYISDTVEEMVPGAVKEALKRVQEMIEKLSA